MGGIGEQGEDRSLCKKRPSSSNNNRELYHVLGTYRPPSAVRSAAPDHPQRNLPASPAPHLTSAPLLREREADRGASVTDDQLPSPAHCDFPPVLLKTSTHTQGSTQFPRVPLPELTGSADSARTRHVTRLSRLRCPPSPRGVVTQPPAQEFVPNEPKLHSLAPSGHVVPSA